MTLPPFTTIAWYGNFIILLIIAVIALGEYMFYDYEDLKKEKEGK